MSVLTLENKIFFQIKLFCYKKLKFQIIHFIPSWNIYPQGSPDPYQSYLYQRYCDYVGAYYQERPLSSRNKYLDSLNKYSNISEYLNGCFLALKDWS